MTAELPDIRSFTYSELEAFMLQNGEAKFRAGQIFEWLHRGAVRFDDMTNLSLNLRNKLKRICKISGADIAEKFVSKDGTIKYLIRLEDGECVETVVMHYHHGVTICISSQVGCRMMCGFCASAIGGLVRSLTSGEILGQVLTAQRDIGERISNIVMMGIGEPLDNLENVKKFLENVNHPKGLNIGYRHISISTCGLPGGIDEVAQLDIPINLCISLHAANDEVRSSMMPINKKHNIASVIDACKRYQSVTGRRITFEYAMVRGVNDSEENARELTKLLKGMLCHVNVIPVNTVEERSYEKSGDAVIERFIAVLADGGIAATKRRELGSDISASCGQLRKNRM